MTHEGRSKTTVRQENQTFKIDVNTFKRLKLWEILSNSSKIEASGRGTFFMLGISKFFNEQKELNLDLVR